ncbi:hypothetical protein OS493_034233 [Desmophyllum pertusum]|uniref:Uncharacterized protein n=1 Tax=Desmophyllum pertusum TaxID=174260 RepID=A0A9X0CUH6_9CNID|nr:hypothetical protein OS493_034233 [Desmophyllum pertusum]
MCTEQVKNTKHVRRFGNDQSSKQPKKQEGIHASDSADALPHHQHTTTILQRLHDLEESFRVRGYSILRWGLSALVVAGLVIYVFREPLRENVADEVADVASRSLTDENVILKANEVTRAVLQDVLHDPEITKLTSAFVMQVLNRDDVRAAAIQLTQHVLSDPSTLEKIGELAKSTLTDLMAHEETRVLLLGYVKALILDQNTKDACKVLLAELVKDPEVKGFMAASLGELVTSTVVKSSAAELGKSVTHQVVNDAEIQQETGNFLWSAAKKTITPGWFG